MPDIYNEALAVLAPPETLDPRVFQGGQACPQYICDFILAMSLFFNDFKDVVLAYRMVMSQLPDDLSIPSKDLGQAGGMSEHLFRILMAIIHEVLELISKNRKALAHPFFQRIVKSLHPEARQAWKTLAAIEVGGKSQQSVAKLIHFARNKVAFHYDAKAIAKGFRSFVVTGRTPYISSKPSMAGTRFYFADAAAQQLTRDEADKQIVEDFFSGKLSIFMQVNHAVREVVSTFVKLRRQEVG